MSYAPDASSFKMAQGQGQNQAQFRNPASANAWNYYQNSGGQTPAQAQAQAAAAASLMAIRQSHPQPSSSVTAPLVRMAPSPEPNDEESEPESLAGDSRPGKRQPASLKGLFTKDLKEIMFGLGDEAPAPDTVGLMEDILVEYLHETIHAAGQGAGKTIQMDDLRRALQGPGDERKLARLEELMVLQIEIKKARAINGLEAGGRNLGD